MAAERTESDQQEVDQPRIERAVREILAAVGEDPDREGLRETPSRVARMYAELFGGLRLDPKVYLEKFFTEKYDEIVLVRDIFVWPSTGDFDVDSTAILLGVTKRVRVICNGMLDPKLATQLEAAWERGQVRIVKRGKHMRLKLREESD